MCRTFFCKFSFYFFIPFPVVQTTIYMRVPFVVSYLYQMNMLGFFFFNEGEHYALETKANNVFTGFSMQKSLKQSILSIQYALMYWKIVIVFIVFPVCYQKKHMKLSASMSTRTTSLFCSCFQHF